MTPDEVKNSTSIRYIRDVIEDWQLDEQAMLKIGSELTENPETLEDGKRALRFARKIAEARKVLGDYLTEETLK